jgi:hypothetical protein
VSPRTYARIYRSNAHVIKRAVVLPPELGKKGFGRILVEFDVPLVCLRPKVMVDDIEMPLTRI